MDHMKLETPDLTAQNIEKIGALFPNCVTETVDENGKPKKAINFDLLRQMLSSDVVVIEHNLDVIKTADYIIDIGPEGGDKGGTVIACGTPEEVAANPVSYTGQYVSKYLR